MSPPVTIALVEDDDALAEVVADYLSRQGYLITRYADGPSAVEGIVGAAPSLVILDIMLPGLDGLEVCRCVRGRYDGPILMLTARVENIDEIVGLAVGADDYVHKPVVPRLLLARIQALLRRAAVRATPLGELRFGPINIDTARREVRVDGIDVGLTTAQFDLVALLASRAGQVIDRDTLHRELRGIEYDGRDRSIDLRISRVRKKLGPAGEDHLRAVRGQGYLWAPARG